MIVYLCPLVDDPIVLNKGGDGSNPIPDVGDHIELVDASGVKHWKVFHRTFRYVREGDATYPVECRVSVESVGR